MLADDWIYYKNYSENNNLYKIRKDGTEKTLLLSEGTVRAFNADNEFIFLLKKKTNSYAK
jgi:hypothetical protein